MNRKYFTYRNIEFALIAAAPGTIRCTAVWPRSKYDLLRKPLQWFSHDTVAFDNLIYGMPATRKQLKEDRAAMRTFYHEYKQQIEKL